MMVCLVLAWGVTHVIEPPDVLTVDAVGLPRAMRPVQGEHLVRPDGTVSLGVYGDVRVNGLTPEQAGRAIGEQLSRFVRRKRAVDVRVAIKVNNSKFCYVITAEKGEDRVTRLPLSGKETVLDAVAGVKGLARVAAAGPTWLSRDKQLLPVDWRGITLEGASKTNYLLLPGDRLYVARRPGG